MTEYRFDHIRAQLQSAQENSDYDAIDGLDKQLRKEFSTIDMNKLASNPEQLKKLEELIDGYRSTIEFFQDQKKELGAQLSGLVKSKKAVTRYQEVKFNTVG